MPMYKYRCSECGEEFRVLQDPNDDKPECPKCGYDGTNKMMSNANLRFKGDGFYRTDYDNNKSRETNEEDDESATE